MILLHYNDEQFSCGHTMVYMWQVLSVVFVYVSNTIPRAREDKSFREPNNHIILMTSGSKDTSMHEQKKWRQVA